MLPALLALLLAQAGGPRQEGVPIGQGTKAPKVTLSEPSGGWTVGRMMRVAGRVSDPTVDPVVLSINGDRYLVRTSNGEFSREFPAASGKNVVTALATNRGGTGRDQATSYAKIPAVPLKVVLTSDTDGVYTDLHVYEPTDGSQSGGSLTASAMAHVYWANTESPSGGTFFLNEQGGNYDQPGYGPYLYIHRAPPKGVYLIATNYWPSGDKAHTIATLNVTLFEGTAREVKRKVQVPLATPGTTRVLAWINFVDAEKALVYVPTADPEPEGDQWPGNLEDAAKELAQSGDGGGGGDYGYEGGY